jgi:1,4-alpha-glucan branching enzyme
VEDMRRWPSMHFFGSEDAGKEDAPDAKILAGSQAAPMSDFQAMVKRVGDDVLDSSKRKFGLQQQNDESWTYREWLPDMKAVNLVGDFNGWNTEATPLAKDTTLEDVWTCEIKADQAKALKKGQKYKVFATKHDGHQVYIIPSWTTRMSYSDELKMLDAIVWPVKPKASLSKPVPGAKGGERIYECHLGLAARPGQPKSFKEAAEVIIPRAVKNGYNALVLIGVQECKRYSDMGSQPAVHFAPMACLGEPEDLQNFVEKAHAAGIRVYMSPAHDGAAWSADCLADHYFRSGATSIDQVTGSRAFDYSRPEVVRYLMSNLVYWMELYGIDGFRHARAASMI